MVVRRDSSGEVDDKVAEARQHKPNHDTEGGRSPSKSGRVAACDPTTSQV